MLPLKEHKMHEIRNEKRENSPDPKLAIIQPRSARSKKVKFRGHFSFFGTAMQTRRWAPSF